MLVGVPKEIKNHEYRVAITPAGVVEFVKNGHQVVVEKNAGVGSAISDDEYVKAGAKILDSSDEVWAKSDLILKVKEPIAAEYPKMRKDQILFTYLHLAASKDCTDALIKSGTTAIAYDLFSSSTVSYAIAVVPDFIKASVQSFDAAKCR